MSLTFTPTEWATVRRERERVHAKLASRGTYEPRRFDPPLLTLCRREFIAHDEDGNEVGRKTSPIESPGDEEHRRVVLTVLLVEEIDVVSTEAVSVRFRPLGLDDARACGVRSVAALRLAWRERHPRSDLAILVWFALGDQRDRSKFLNWSGRAGGDYTFNPRRAIDSDAPCLTPEEYAGLGMIARQREAKRREATSARLASETDAQRMARIEVAREELKAKFAREIRVCEDRLARIERRYGIGA